MEYFEGTHWDGWEGRVEKIMSMLLKKNKIKLNSGEVDFAIDSL